jgi:hypothetical protein
MLLRETAVSFTLGAACCEKAWPWLCSQHAFFMPARLPPVFLAFLPTQKETYPWATCPIAAAKPFS